jgi:hypothetical protein
MPGGVEETELRFDPAGMKLVSLVTDDYENNLLIADRQQASTQCDSCIVEMLRDRDFWRPTSSASTSWTRSPRYLRGVRKPSRRDFE